jgi:hypothetical protein
MTKQLCPKCGRPIGYGAIAGQAHAAKYHTEPTPSAPSRSGPRWEAMGLRIGQLVAVAVAIRTALGGHGLADRSAGRRRRPDRGDRPHHSRSDPRGRVVRFSDRHPFAWFVIAIVVVLLVMGAMQAAGLVDWHSFNPCPAGQERNGDRLENECVPIP